VKPGTYSWTGYTFFTGDGDGGLTELEGPYFKKTLVLSPSDAGPQTFAFVEVPDDRGSNPTTFAGTRTFAGTMVTTDYTCPGSESPEYGEYSADATQLILYSSTTYDSKPATSQMIYTKQ
jgi:hypothetical protein